MSSCWAGVRTIPRWMGGSGPRESVEGYRGFAIGRSIWWDPLKFFVDGAMPRDETVVQIASNYRRFVAVWEQGLTRQGKSRHADRAMSSGPTEATSALDQQPRVGRTLRSSRLNTR